MIWALWIVGAVVGLIAVIVVIGLLLPQNHQATCSAHLTQPAEAVFATITNWKDFPNWRSGLKSVSGRVGENGRMSWVETTDQGTMPFEVIEMKSPSHLVTKIADPKLPFGGTWTWEIQSDATGCNLTVTEDGEVYNPVFRFMSRFVFGYEASMRRVLADLQRKFPAG